MPDTEPSTALEVQEVGVDQVPLPPAPVDQVATAVASMGSKMTYARALAQSNLIPANLKVWHGTNNLDLEATTANLFLVMEYGQLLDLAPVTALSEINVVKGKPGMSAKLMRARVRQAGHKLRILTPPEDRRRECTVKIILADDPEGSEPFTFTVADAAAMDLCKLNADGTPSHRSKEGKALAWESMTDTMLLERATAKAVRGTCPEILLGVGYTTEELEAMAEDAPAPSVPVAPEDIPSKAWRDWAKAEILTALGKDVEKARSYWTGQLDGDPLEISERQARALVEGAAAVVVATVSTGSATGQLRADGGMVVGRTEDMAPASAPPPPPVDSVVVPSSPATPAGDAAADAAGDVDAPPTLSEEAQATLVAEIEKLRQASTEKLVEVGHWATDQGINITADNLPNLTQDDFTKLMRAIRNALRTGTVGTAKKAPSGGRPAKAAAKAAPKPAEPDPAEVAARLALRAELSGRAELLTEDLQARFLTQLAEAKGPTGMDVAGAIESCPPAWDAWLTAAIEQLEDEQDASLAEPEPEGEGS